MKNTINKDYPDFKTGSAEDDAQYLSLLYSSKKGSSYDNGICLCTSTLKNGQTFNIVLKGESEIVNSKGEKVQSSDVYLDYINRGRNNSSYLQFDKLAFIEILFDNKGEIKRRQRPLDVVYSIADALEVLKKYESTGEVVEIV